MQLAAGDRVRYTPKACNLAYVGSGAVRRQVSALRGQGSREYLRLCGMLEYFKPAPNLVVETLSDNGRLIYNQICQTLGGTGL